MRPMIRYVREKLRGPLVGAEIGVGNGGNAMDMVRGLDLKELHLVDTWGSYRENNQVEKRYQGLYDNVVQKFSPYPNVKIHRKESIQAAFGFPDGHFDFIYIDACHDEEAVSQDIRFWLPKVRSGGIIGGHDYGSRWQEVVRAVDWWVTDLKKREVGFRFLRMYPDWMFVMS